MTIYNPANLSDPLHSTGNRGNGQVTHGSAVVSAALALADVVRPCRIAAGTKVHRVVIKNTDLDDGAALAAKIGYLPEDGSAGDDDAFAAAAAWGQSAATTTIEIFPPILVEKDSYLSITVSTAAGTGAAGTVYAKVEGEAIGAK